MSAVRAKKRPRNAAATGSEVIAEWVRERLRRGRLVPGQRLVEADIIAQTGASRGKVREALQRLQAEHLVTIEEFRGASVRQIGPQELHQIYRTRMVLEGLAAAEFAAADAPQLKQRLQRLQEQMNRWRESGGHDRFAELNSQWHELIAQGSANTWLLRFLPSLTIPIYRLLFSSFYTDERIDEANADHRKITAAIIEGRAADAEAAMREHISAGLAGVSELSARFID